MNYIVVQSLMDYLFSTIAIHPLVSTANAIAMYEEFGSLR